MPTNEKKKSKGTTMKKLVVPPTTKPTPIEPKPTALSRPQWTMLILLSMGLARLLQVQSASLITTTTAPDDEEEHVINKTCVEYLGKHACQQLAVSHLLRLKFHTGLQSALLVAAGMWQCWHHAPQLEAFHALFVLSPMATGAAALYASQDYIILPQRHIIWKQGMILMVLSLLALPASPNNLPFWSAPRYRQQQQQQQQQHSHNNKKTLQSLCLISLVLMNAGQAGHWLFRAGQRGEWPEVAASSLVRVDLTSAVTPIVAFVVVDWCTNAVVHAFGWYYFTQSQQRVRAFT